MIRDVNFTFMWLIVSLLMAMLGISIYYQTTYGEVLKEHEKTTENLTAANERLTYIENYLTEAASELNVSKEREEDLGLRYLELRSQKEELDAQNKELQADLESTRARLSSTKAQLSSTQAQLSSTQAQLSSTQAQLESAKRTITSKSNEINSLTSQLAACQAQQGG